MSKTIGKAKTKTETRKRPVKSQVSIIANDALAAGAAVSRTAVADLAYQLFLQRGAQHGHDVDDWMAAERLLSLN